MGYRMHQTGGEFFIAAGDKARALAAIKSLHGQETYGDHFSWVDTPEFLRADSLEGALRVWRWDAEADGDGNIVALEFAGENLGDDEKLFGTIAPFVRAGSYIEMTGEDNEMWRWVFADGTCREITPTVTWPAMDSAVDA
jgi:hypothetical protein